MKPLPWQEKGNMEKTDKIPAVSKNQKILLAVLAFLCFLQFVFFPLLQWKKDSLDQIAVLKRGIAEKQNLLKQEADIEAMLNKALKKLDAASELFWKDAADPQALMLKTQKMVEALAPEMGVEIKSVEWGQAPAESVIRAQVVINASALPEDLLNFIAEIESADRFYTLDQLRLDCRERFEGIQAHMALSAYGMAP